MTGPMTLKAFDNPAGICIRPKADIFDVYDGPRRTHMTRNSTTVHATAGAQLPFNACKASFLYS